MAQCCMGYCGLLLTNAVLMRREPVFCYGAGFSLLVCVDITPIFSRLRLQTGRSFFGSVHDVFSSPGNLPANRTTKPTQRYHA